MIYASLRLLIALLIFGLVYPPSLLAQAAPVPVSIDLSSTARTAAAPAQSQPLTINVGGVVRNVAPHDLLTPAENIALQQILTTGSQSIMLSAQGNAIGGTLRLDNLLNQQILDLVIPSGVTAIHNFATQNSLNLGGNLTNSGNLYAISTSNAVTTAIINATNIFNQTGANLSSVLPVNGLPGATGAISQLNLTLNAIHDIVNAGRITSSGNLTATAGGSIINALPAGMTGAVPVFQAANNLSLNSGIGNIVNSGNLASVTGNVDLVSQAMHDLIINNVGGRIAAAGDINVGSPDAVGKVNLSVIGGDFLSKQLNAFSGNGIAKFDVSKLFGTLNIHAGEAHVQAETPDLTLGAIELTGDPTFYNTMGNVILTSSLTLPGQPLAIVAGRDILTSGTGIGINTGSSSGNGGNILLVAGALFTSSGASAVQPPTAGSAPTITITGASSAGGSIRLDGVTSLSSASTVATNGNGGTFTAVAFAGSDPSSGVISVPTAVNLSTAGKGTGTSGNVNFIAGASSGTALSVGNITTAGGANNTGTVSLVTAQPVITGTAATIQNDLLSSGGFAPGAATNGSISVGSITTTGAAISVASSQNALLGALTATGSTSSAGGNISISTKSATAFTLGTGVLNGTTAPIISNAGATSGAGGSISVSNTGTGGITVPSLGYVSNTSSANGAGGSLTLDANSGALSIPTGSISVNGGTGSANGGSVYLRGSSIGLTGTGALAISADATGTGNGGNITVISSGSASDMTLGSASGNFNLFARGGSTSSAAGNGGTVTVSAGRNVTANSVAAAPRGNNGTGANFNLSAGTAGAGRLFINGALSANGVGTGSGGILTLSSNSTSDFLIGAATTNGSTGALTANDGSGAGGTAGTVSVTNSGTGGITIGNLSNLSAAASSSGQGGNISLVTNGVLTAPAGTISVNAGAGNGGSITLDALSFSVTGKKELALTANGGGTGNGGSVTVISRSATADLLISDADDAFTIFVSSGNTSGSAGTVYTSSGRNVTVSGSSGLANVANGRGVDYTLVAGTGGAGNLNFDTPLSANASGTGRGGNILLISNSATPFTIGSNTANGVNGGLISNAGTTGAGGSITIRNQGTGGIVVLNTTTNLVVTAAGTGAGGAITLDAAAGAIPGPLTIAAGTINAKAVGSSANLLGGQITLSGSTLSFTGTGPLILDASSPTIGTGGSISVTTTAATSDISVGLLTGQIKLVANGGFVNSVSGNGGTVYVTAGRALTVAPTGLLAGPLGLNGSGANITLTAGTALSITAAFSANGIGNGSGGSISLTSNSATAFNLGGGGTNGITGATTANAGNTSGGGGSITVNNNGGGITLGSLANLSLTASAGGGKGGTFIANAAGTLTLPTGTISTNATNGNFGGGLISLKGSSLSVTGSALLLTADGTGTGNAGTLSVVTTGSTSDLTVGAGQLVLTARGGTTSGDGGNVTVTAGRTLTVTTSSLNLAPRGTNGKGAIIALGSGSAGTLSITGALSADGVGTGNGGSITLTTLGSAADIKVGNAAGEYSLSANGVSAGAINLSAGRNLIVNSTFMTVSSTGANANGGNVTLEAGTAGTGNLQVSGSLAVNGVGTGNGGLLTIRYNDSTNPFVIGAPVANSGITGNLFANAPSSGNGGNITIINAAAAALNLALTGSLSATSASGSAGTITLDKTAQLVQVQGTGSLLGALRANGASVNLQLSAATTPLTLTNVSSTNGNVSIVSNAPGASLTVLRGGSIVSSGNVSLTSGYFTNYGTVTASGTNGSISISGDGLSVNGVGTYLANGPGTNSVSLTSTNGALNLESSNLYGPGAGGAVTLQSPTAINFAAASSQVLTGGVFNVLAPTVTFGAHAMISGTSSVNFAPGSTSNLTIVLPAQGSATVSTTSGSINFTPTSGNALTFSVSGGGVGTLNLLGSNSNATVASNVLTVDSGVTVSTDKLLTLTSNTIVNNGTLTSPTGTASATNYLALLSNGGSLNVSGTGLLAIGSLMESANGAVNVTQSAVNVVTSYNSRGFTLTAATPSLSDIFTQSGSISVTTPTGGISVVSGKTLSAVEGNITLRSNDLVNGFITVGSGATLTATSARRFGNINLVLGPVPVDPVVGITPPNMTVNAGDLGFAFFGTNSISSLTSSGVGNTINATGANVVFNTGAKPASAITIAGNVNFNATGNPRILDSLDLTDPTVTRQLLFLQTHAAIGGTLQTTNGIATGGSAVLTPANFLGSISAANIPADVTLTMANFSASNPLDIVITSDSTTKQFLINGTQQFTGPSASPIVSITSNLTGPALVINPGAQLTSTGSLSFTAPSMRNAGLISAATSISLSGATDLSFGGTGSLTAPTVNISAGNGILGFVRSGQTSSGNLNLQGSVVSIDAQTVLSSGANLNITTPSAIINGTLVTTGSAGQINVQNTGSLSVSGLPQLIALEGGSGSSVNLSATGTLSLSSNNFKITTGTGDSVNLAAPAINFGGITILTVNGGGAVNVNTPAITLAGGAGIVAAGASAITVAAPAGSSLIVQSNDNFTKMTTVGGSINFNAPSGHNVTFQSNGSASGILALNGGPVTVTTSSGTLTVAGNMTVSSNNNFALNVNDGTLLINGTLTSTRAAGTIDIASLGNLTLSGSPVVLSLTGSGANAINVTAAGNLLIDGGYKFSAGSSGTTTVLAQGSAGKITVGAGTTQTISAGSLHLSAPTIVLGDGASVISSASSAFTLDSGSADSGLTLLLPSNGSAGITTKGTLLITSPSAQELRFSNSAGGTSSLNLAGSTVTMTIADANLVVDPGVNLKSANNLVLNINNGTLANAGSLRAGSDSVSGQLTVQSTGLLSITNPSNLFVSAISGSANGGILSIAAAGGLSIGSGSLNASATGSGDGGKITIAAASLSITGGNLALVSNGAENGNGGAITVTASGALSDLEVASGSSTFSVSASGAGTGNGGTLQLTSARGIVINTGSMVLSPGPSGNGGDLTVTAGSAGAGNLQVFGSLNLNGAGAGNGGKITLTYNDGNPFVIGSNLTNSGVSGSITATAPGAGLGGSIKISNLAASPLTINNSGVVSTASALGTAGTITLIGSNQNVSLNSTGSLVGNVALSGNSVSLSATSLTGSLSGVAAAAYSANVTSGGLVLGDITANNGSLSATVAAGTLSVLPGKTLYSSQGNINLLNTDAANGEISIGSAVTLMASTTGTILGGINVAIGSIPGTPIAGAKPANFVETLSNGGEIFYGANGISSIAPSNTAKVNDGRIVFDTGSRAAGAISLGGNVIMYSYQAIPVLTSLDLSNGGVASGLRALQVQGRLGGLLTLNGSNVATGGTLILLPFQYGNISSINVPANVVVTNEGFHNAPINVAITGSSTTKQVLVNGSFRFASANAPSIGTLNITTTQTNVPLQINAAGSVISDGIFSANVSSGSITLNGAVTAPTINIATKTSHGIAYGGNITATESLSLTTAGSGAITRSGGALTAPLLYLTSTTGNIGTVATPLTIAVSGTLYAKTGGNGAVSVSNSGALNVGDSSVGGTYTVSSSGNLTVSGAVTAGGLTLRTTANNANIIVTGSAIASGAVSLLTQGSGNATITSSGTVQSSANTVSVTVNDLDLSGTIASGTSSITIKPNSARGMRIAGVGNGDGSMLDVNADEMGRMTAKTTLFLGDLTSTSSMVLGGNIDLSSAPHNLTLQTAGSFVGTGTSAILDDRSYTVSATGNLNTGSISSGTGTTVFTSGATATVDGSLTQAGGQVRIFGRSVDISELVTAPSITIAPSVNNVNVALGDGDSDATFKVSTSMLSMLTGKVTIGDNTRVPTMTVTSDLSVPGAISDLTLFATDYVGTGRTLTLSGANLTIFATGLLNTGSINAQNARLNLTAPLTLTVDGTISVGSTKTVTLTTSTGSNADIVLAGNLNGGDFILKSDNNILWQSGLMSGRNLTFTATKGNIGQKLLPIQTAAYNLTMTTGTTGSAYVSEADDVILPSWSIGGEIEIAAGGAISVNRLLAKNGSITVHAGSGIGLVAGQSITANEGNIVLQADTGYIQLGANATVLAYTADNPNLGNVTLAVGAIPGTPVSGTGPSNLILNTQDGGQVFFGAQGITAIGRANTVVAIARNVVFSTGSSPASSIVLGGGVSITADPPESPFSIVATPPSDDLNGFTPIAVTPFDADGSSQPTLAPVQIFNGFDGAGAGGGAPSPTYTPPLTVETATPSAGGDSITVPVVPVLTPHGTVSIISNLQALSKLPSLIVESGAVGFTSSFHSSTATQQDTQSFFNMGSQTTADNATSESKIRNALSDQSSDCANIDSLEFRSENEFTSDKKKLEGELQPIAFMQPVAPSAKALESLQSIQTAACIIKHLGDAEIVEDQPGVLLFRNGEAIINSTGRTIIHCGAYSLSVATGTIAVIRKHNGITTVSNLYEKAPNSVRVTMLLDGKYVSIAAGHQISLGKTESEVKASIAQDPVSRRGLRAISMSSGHKLVTSEISLTSLLENSNVLRAMQRSNNTSDRVIANRVTKMAACLLMVTAKRGPYAANNHTSW